MVFTHTSQISRESYGSNPKIGHFPDMSLRLLTGTFGNQSSNSCCITLDIICEKS